MEVADATMAQAPSLALASGASTAAPAATTAASAPPKPNASGEAENIAVCIRVRPLNEREVRNKDVAVLRTISSMNLVTVTDTDGTPLQGKHNVFQYDHIFDERSSTRAMYERVAQRIVKSSLDGINGTIFAYGQTSSGKTYTMAGTGGVPFQDDAHSPSESMGILQLAVEDIFGYIEQSTDRDFLLRVSFVEIYNEVVKDLLNPSEKGTNLKLREDPRKGVYVESKEEIITTYEDILRLLDDGNQRRTVGTTAMNDKSSRSHSIFRIVIESKEKSASRRQSEDDVNGAVLVASLSLVDLAGSESMRHTAAEGARQREAGNINKSLLTLSRVINSLAGSGPATQNAPFRDSKLTRLLQNSLDGNTRTLIICCVTPADRYIDETKSTLQFAARAKTIQTSASVNEVLDDQAQLRRLKREVHELKKLVNSDEAYNALKAENEALQHEQNKNKAEIGRLLGLMLSSSSASVRGLASSRKTRRHKRMRETWHPGDFSANMVATKALRSEFGAFSPNPQPRKRQIQLQSAGDTKENVDPQNLMGALNEADDDDDGDDDDDDNESNCSYRRVSDPSADSPQRLTAEGRAYAEEQIKQLVGLLESAIVANKKQTRFEDDQSALDVEARMMRLVAECQTLAQSASENEKLAGDYEVLKMAAEELQTRLQISQDQEQTELDNTKELFKHVKHELAEVQEQLEAERAEAEELRTEKQQWAAARKDMEAEMAGLRAQLEALSGLDGGAARGQELERSVHELTRQNDALTSALTEVKQAAEEMQRLHEEKIGQLKTSSKHEIDELSSQLQDAFVEQEELKLEKDDEITKLEEELLAKSDELEHKTAELGAREADLVQEIAALKSTQAASGEAEQALASLTRRCEELATENERLTTERSHLMDAMVELEEQLQQTTKTNADVETKVNSVKTENAELSTKLAPVEENLTAIQLERDAVAPKLEELQVTHDDNATERVRFLEQELAQVQSELAEAGNDQEAEANRADEAMREFETAKLTMEEMIQTHKQELEKLSTEAAGQLGALQQERESLVLSLNEQLAEKEAKIQQAEAVAVEARSYRDFLQDEMDELSQKVSGLENAKSHFANENAHLRHQLIELNNEMLQVPDTLASEIEELTDRIESLRAELDTKIANEKILTTEIKKFMHRTTDLEAQLADKTSEVARLQESVQTLDEEKAVWFQKSASSEELQAEIVRMREERWGLATKWEESEAALTKERRESQRLAAELRDLVEEHESLEEQKTTVAKTLAEKESRVRQLASELDATQTEKSALEDLVTELEGKFEVLEIAKKSLDDLLSVRVAELATKAAETAELRTQLEQAQAQLQTLGAQLEESLLQVSTSAAVDSDALQERICSLEQQCEELTTSQSSLHAEASAVKQAKADLVEELGALESQLVSLSEEKIDLQSKLDSAVATLDESASKTADASEKMSSLTRELDVTREELARVNTTKLELIETQSQLEKSLDNLKASLAEKESQLESHSSSSTTDLSGELATLTLRLEAESEQRAKAEMDSKSYEEALEMMRDDFKHKLDALKTSQIAAKESLASKQSLEAEVAKLRLDLGRAKEEQDELRYQNHQRLVSTQGSESLLQETVELLEQELTAAKNTLVKTENDWKARAQQAEQQFRRLEGELQSSNAKQQELKQRLEAVEEQLVASKDALVNTDEEWKARAQQAEQHFRRLEGELQDVNEERARLAEAAERASSSSLEVEELKSQIMSLSTVKQQLQHELESRERSWAEQVDEVTRKGNFENSSLREHLQEAQDEVEAVKKFADDQISQLRAAVETSETQLSESSRAAKQREVALANQVEELESKLSELRTTTCQIQAKLNEREESSGELVSELSSKVDQLKQQLYEVELESGNYADQLVQLKEAMEKLEGENYQHRNELEELTESLKSAQLEAMHYHNQLMEAQGAKEKMDELVDTQKKRIDKLEKVKMTTETLEVFRKLKSDRQAFQLQVQKLEKQLKDVSASKALTKEAADQQASRLLRLKEEEVGMLKTHIDELKTHIEELKRAVQNEKDRNTDMRKELQSVVEDIRDKAQQEVEDMRAVLKEKSDQVVELEDHMNAMTKDKDALVERKSSKESYLEKENLDLLVENRQLKKRLEGRGATTTNGLSYRPTMLNDEVAAFEASAKAASALLAEPSAASSFSTVATVTPAKQAAAKLTEKPVTSAKKSSGGLSSFLLSSSTAAAGAEEEEEEARPACSQQ